MTFGVNVEKTLEQSLHASVFVQVCFFINFSSFKPDTENNANFDAVSSKRANYDEMQFMFDVCLSYKSYKFKFIYVSNFATTIGD